MRSSSAAIRLISLLLFLVLVAIVAYWSMQLLAPRGAIAPTDSLGDSSRPPLPVASRLFGAPNKEAVAEAPPPVNVKVFGIVDAGRRGVAILSIDGRPAKAYAVNQKIDGGSVVKSVQADKVVIEHQGTRIEAEAPLRYSLDILSSNKGNSSLPAGIEEVGDMNPDENGEEPQSFGAQMRGLDGERPDVGDKPPAPPPGDMEHPNPLGRPRMHDGLPPSPPADFDPQYEDQMGGYDPTEQPQIPPDYEGDPAFDPQGMADLTPEEQAAAQRALEEGRELDAEAIMNPGGPAAQGMSFQRPAYVND